MLRKILFWFLFLNATWCSCNITSMLITKRAAFVSMALRLSDFVCFLGADNLDNNIWHAKTDSVSSRELLDWFLGIFNRFYELSVVECTSLTNDRDSLMTLCLFPWCSESFIARTIWQCSNHVSAPLGPACCWDCTVRKQH